jgi:hypothetical protein
MNNDFTGLSPSLFGNLNVGYLILFVMVGFGGLFLWLYFTYRCPACKNPWMRSPRGVQKLGEETIFRTESQQTSHVDAQGQNISVNVRVPYRQIDQRFHFICKGCNHTWFKDERKLVKG